MVFAGMASSFLGVTVFADCEKAVDVISTNINNRLIFIVAFIMIWV
jgi:hypothetical protein